MTKYVLIGQKKDGGDTRTDEILGYYTDLVTLHGDKEYYSRTYCKFFIGREDRTSTDKLPPVSDATLLDLLRKAAQ